MKTLLQKISAEKRGHLRQRLCHPAWLGTIRRTKPLSDYYGYDRGTPVDRYYIESFLDSYRFDIHGRVLEVKNSSYTQRFGAGVEQWDVLDINPANPLATIKTDLAAADEIASDSFDCFILTQTLQLIYNFQAAIMHAHRILKPSGVLLVTVPSVSRVVYDGGKSKDYWRFTTASCISLFGDIFGPDHVTVRSYGNVLSAIAFLSGMAYEELSHHELNAHDNYFPVIIAVRAVK